MFAMMTQNITRTPSNTFKRVFLRKQLTAYKHSILDVSRGSEYASTKKKAPVKCAKGTLDAAA